MGAIERRQAAADRHARGAADERHPQAVAFALADASEHQVAAVLELLLVGDHLHALGELARQRGEIERLVHPVFAQPAREGEALLVLLEAAEALGAAALVLGAQALDQAQRRSVERAGRVAQHQACGGAGLADEGVDDQVGDDVFDGAHGVGPGRGRGAILPWPEGRAADRDRRRSRGAHDFRNSHRAKAPATFIASTASTAALPAERRKGGGASFVTVRGRLWLRE